MFEIVVVILFIWLLIKTLGFMLKVAWGAAKIIALLLLLLAAPALVLCLLFASGLILLAPLLLIAVACVILSRC